MSNSHLGEIENQEFIKKLQTFKTTLEKKKDTEQSMTTKVKSLTELNKKVTDSYNVSLKIIVDVTKLLNQYMVYFNEIETLMERLNNSKNSNTISGNYFNNINALTSQKIDELSLNFQKQLKSLKTVYNKNNLDTSELDQYNDLIGSISTESKSLLKKQTGGKNKRR